MTVCDLLKLLAEHRHRRLGKRDRDAEDETERHKQPLEPIRPRGVQEHLADVLARKRKAEVDARKKDQKAEVNRHHAEQHAHELLFRQADQEKLEQQKHHNDRNKRERDAAEV